VSIHRASATQNTARDDSLDWIYRFMTMAARQPESRGRINRRGLLRNCANAWHICVTTSEIETLMVYWSAAFPNTRDMHLIESAKIDRPSFSRETHCEIGHLSSSKRPKPSSVGNCSGYLIIGSWEFNGATRSAPTERFVSLCFRITTCADSYSEIHTKSLANSGLRGTKEASP